MESVNGLFKNVFEWGGQVPVKGLKRTQLIVLGAVLLYQLVLLYQFDRGKPLAQGIKPLHRAAWVMTTSQLAGSAYVRDQQTRSLPWNIWKEVRLKWS